MARHLTSDDLHRLACASHRPHPDDGPHALDAPIAGTLDGEPAAVATDTRVIAVLFNCSGPTRRLPERQFRMLAAAAREHESRVAAWTSLPCSLLCDRVGAPRFCSTCTVCLGSGRSVVDCPDCGEGHSCTCRWCAGQGRLGHETKPVRLLGVRVDAEYVARALTAVGPVMDADGSCEIGVCPAEDSSGHGGAVVMRGPGWVALVMGLVDGGEADPDLALATTAAP